MTGLTLNESAHTYLLDGSPLPSVTQIIEDSGYVENGANFYTPTSRQRGSATHEAVRLANQYAPKATALAEVLDVMELDERLHGSIGGYMLFKKETGFVPFKSEVLVSSRRLRVAGKLDIWGMIGERRTLVDLKGWRNQGIKPKRPAMLQTGGYKILLKETTSDETDQRIVLKLPGDGTFRMYVCNDAGDETVFTALATVWWDRYAHGYVKIRGE